MGHACPSLRAQTEAGLGRHKTLKEKGDRRSPSRSPRRGPARHAAVTVPLGECTGFSWARGWRRRKPRQSPRDRAPSGPLDGELEARAPVAQRPRGVSATPVATRTAPGQHPPTHTLLLLLTLFLQLGSRVTLGKSPPVSEPVFSSARGSDGGAKSPASAARGAGWPSPECPGRQRGHPRGWRRRLGRAAHSHGPHAGSCANAPFNARWLYLCRMKPS